MIYYLIALTTGILIDYNDLKNSNSKSDIIFYVISIVVCIIGVFFLQNENREGIAEIFIKTFGVGG